MKFTTQHTENKEIEIKLPFYAYILNENSDVYVMVTEKEIKKITIYSFGSLDFFKCNHDGHISNEVIENESTETEYLDAFSNAKDYVDKF